MSKTYILSLEGICVGEDETTAIFKENEDDS